MEKVKVKVMKKDYKIGIDGKSTGVGAFEDGKIFRPQLDGSVKTLEPVRVERSKTGNHWTSFYSGVTPDDIVVRWGYSRGGRPKWSVEYADGRPYNKPDALDLVIQVSGDKNIL